MSLRHLLVAAAVALIGGYGPVAPAAAHAASDPNGGPALLRGTEVRTAAGEPARPAALLVLQQPGPDADRPAGTGGYGPGSGRFGANVAVVVALAGVIIGGLALARAGRLGGVVAGVAGLTGAALGGYHLAGAAGGLGTGSGRAGAVVAIALGVAATVVGGLAVARSRRTARPA